MLRLEQNPLHLLHRILQNSTNPGGMGSDPCANTGETAKACLLEN